MNTETNDFDLNISNYTLDEIEEFFKLSDEYSLSDILNNEKTIVQIILSNNNYDRLRKLEITDFISKAKDKLVLELKRELLESDMLPAKTPLIIKSEQQHTVNQTSAFFNGSNFTMNQERTSINEMLDPTKYLNPVETFPTNIARSNLNNLRRKTIMQTVILNSIFREDTANTSATDFNMVLPYYFKNVLSLRLSSLQLPNVLFCFSKEKLNTSLHIIEDYNFLQYTVVLPDGNYNSTDFCSTLQTEINALFNTLGPANRFTVNVDPATQKITIANTVNNFTMNFVKGLEPIDFYKTLGWAMGFRTTLYAGLKTYTTESIYNGLATDYIFFVLNDFNNSQSQNILAMYSKSYIGNNILAMIPLNANSFQICFDNGADFIEKKREYFGPVNIQRLKIQLLNQYGEILNLNGMNFSFSLELEIGYDW